VSSNLSRAEYEQTLPDLMRTLHTIQQVNVASWLGFGWIGDNGAGLFPSGRASLPASWIKSEQMASMAGGTLSSIPPFWSGNSSMM
jgi:hypothetical protein